MEVVKIELFTKYVYKNRLENAIFSLIIYSLSLRRSLFISYASLGKAFEEKHISSCCVPVEFCLEKQVDSFLICTKNSISKQYLRGVLDFTSKLKTQYESVIM